MAFDPSELTAGLPAPAGDEPPSLRRDIADELADHIECAWQRESRARPQEGFSDEEIKRRIVERFGMPAAVARRLWWDAVKEQIMSGRITAAMTTLAAAACIACCVFVWQSTRIGNELQAALLESQREANLAMIEQLKAVTASSKPTGDWYPLRVRLVDEQGKPVQGKVTCSGAGSTTRLAFNETIQTSAAGLADFGLVPSNQYTVHITLTALSEFAHFSTFIGPERPAELSITCPTSLPPRRPIRFEIKPPAALAEQPFYYVAEVIGLSRQIAGRNWSTNQEDKMIFLLDASGQILGELSRTEVYDGTTDSSYPSSSSPSGFAMRLPSSVTLKEAGQPRGYLCNVRFVVYRAHLPKPADAPLPELRNLNVQPIFRTSCDLSLSEPQVCKLDPSLSLWSNVRHVLPHTASVPYGN